MGGKSRKKGGVSKKLVQQLMAQYGKGKCKKAPPQIKGLLDESLPKNTGEQEDSS